jgi:hypothetical protein
MQRESTHPTERQCKESKTFPLKEKIVGDTLVNSESNKTCIQSWKTRGQLKEFFNTPNLH